MVDKRYKKIRLIYLIATILLFLFWIVGSFQAFSYGTYPLYYTIYWLFMACVLAGCIYYLSIPLGLRAVHRKLSYKELCEVMSKENLKKVNLSTLNKGYITSDIYVSKHWIYAGETYIPKKLINYLSAQQKKKYSIFYIVTKNGKEIRIADIDNDYVKHFLKILKKACPELSATSAELYENYGKPKFAISKKEWKQMSKEEFLNYIEAK